MSAFLYRLGRNSARHPFIVLAVWLVAAVAIVGIRTGAGGKFRDVVVQVWHELEPLAKWLWQNKVTIAEFAPAPLR